jgi:hypothetical protein
MHSVVSFVSTVLTGCDRSCLVCSNQSAERRSFFLRILCILTVLMLQSNLIFSHSIDVAEQSYTFSLY